MMQRKKLAAALLFALAISGCGIETSYESTTTIHSESNADTYTTFRELDLVPCPENDAEFELIITAHKSQEELYKLTKRFCIYRNQEFAPHRQTGMNDSTRINAEFNKSGFDGSIRYTKVSRKSVAVALDWTFTDNNGRENYLTEFEAAINNSGVVELGSGRTINWSFLPN